MSTTTDHINDEFDSIKPEKTVLLVNNGVTIKGSIEFSGDPDQRIVVLGCVEGDITTTGILQLAKGAVLRPNKKITCIQAVIAGEVIGEGVEIDAKLIMLQASSVVRVDSLRLPAGGLEQSRGSVLNARLNMTEATTTEQQQANNTVGWSDAAQVANAATVVAMPGGDLTADDELHANA